jgi:F-box protein 9
VALGEDGGKKTNADEDDDETFVRHVHLSDDYVGMANASTKGTKRPTIDSLIQKILSLGIDDRQPDVPPDLDSPILSLPPHLMHHILRYVFRMDCRSMLRLAVTCTRMFLVAHDPRIWEFACMTTYLGRPFSLHVQSLVRDALMEDELSVMAANLGHPDDSRESARKGAVERLKSDWASLYHHDWYLTFIEKPRVHVDGIYISTCSYIRYGFLHCAVVISG